MFTTAGKPTVSNAMYGSKLYINDNIPEIAAFRKRLLLAYLCTNYTHVKTHCIAINECITSHYHRYQEGDGYQEKKMVLSVFSPNKKVYTVEEFFAGAIKRMVGSIREAQCVSY